MADSSTTLDFTVSDVFKQRVRTVEDVSPEYTTAELVQELIDQLNMPKNDPMGRSYSYRARLQREARHLHPNERIGDAIESGDWLVLQPNVDAA